MTSSIAMEIHHFDWSKFNVYISDQKRALSKQTPLRQYLAEVIKIPIEGFTYDQPTEQSNRFTMQVSEKRVRIGMEEIQRLIEDKEIQDVKWISKEKQLADGLTKRDVNMDDLLYIFNKTERLTVAFAC